MVSFSHFVSCCAWKRVLLENSKQVFLKKTLVACPLFKSDCGHQISEGEFDVWIEVMRQF